MTTNKPIRTRFAPSPTGYVHLGSLRTSLFSFLFARHNGGTHILRVEDTDQNRLVQGALENLVRVLNSLGIEFDEGYTIKDGQLIEQGSHGPYLQSNRLDIYQKHVQELLEKGSAYYCYCSEQRLEDLRKEQTALKKPPMYDRHCRNFSDSERKAELQKCLDEGRKPVVRMVVPLEGETVVHDIIYGDVTYKHSVLDDQVILKSDGFPTYHLAVVVDDHLMEISHVIRGEEWLPSTPKHILLYKAFGWEPTVFAHTPLILNPDKSKLSKRQGDVAVEDFLKKGYLKEALVNFVAFLGWNPKTEQEIFSLDDLIKEFDLANVNKSGAVFDVNKLDWMNGKYIREKSDSELAELLIPYWEQAGFNLASISKDYLAAIASLEKERLKKLSEIGERTGYFFKEPEYDGSMLVWKKSDAATTKKILSDLCDLFVQLDESDFSKDKLETKIRALIEAGGYDNGTALWPLRVSLTGLEKSPGPFEVASVLGKEVAIRRLEAAAGKL